MTRTRSNPSRRKTSRRRDAGLPAERAFVIQLRADADLARGIVRGRVEHVITGTAAQFDSLEQLLGCMREVVARRSASAGGNGPASA